jgi:hypothetical protein
MPVVLSITFSVNNVPQITQTSTHGQELQHRPGSYMTCSFSQSQTVGGTTFTFSGTVTVFMLSSG